MHFHIENMTCGGCASSVTRAIQSVDPLAKVTADPATRKVEIVSDQPRDAFEGTLKEAGYPATPTN
nr:heavy-metal-associated domain-containing protein [Pelagibacterium lentulum]